jgi:hypothetical protein
MNETLIYGHPAAELELIGDSYYLYETGEYVGDKLPEQFSVNSDSALEWVMEKIFNAEAELLAEAEKVKTILANYERKKARASAKADWFRSRFLPEVEQYAKTKLDGKSKSVDTPFGRISFRTKKGGLRVADKEEALWFAKTEGYTNAIKTTESFLISELTDAQKAVVVQRIPSGFVIEPDSEVCDIKTGVGTGK